MLAGLVGGLAFGAAMLQLGVLPTIASLVRASSPQIGVLVHMAIAVIVGAGFGVLVSQQRAGAGETFFWGLTYGAVWWFLGPLTLLPLLLGRGLAWGLAAAQAAFPSLLGHLVYGGCTALAFVALRRRPRLGHLAVARGALLRGALAGLVCGWLLGLLLDAQGQLLAFAPMVTGEAHRLAWLVVLGIGALAGFVYAL